MPPQVRVPQGPRAASCPSAAVPASRSRRSRSRSGGPGDDRMPPHRPDPAVRDRARRRTGRLPRQVRGPWAEVGRCRPPSAWRTARLFPAARSRVSGGPVAGVARPSRARPSVIEVRHRRLSVPDLWPARTRAPSGSDEQDRAAGRSAGIRPTAPTTRVRGPWGRVPRPGRGSARVGSTATCGVRAGGGGHPGPEHHRSLTQDSHGTSARRFTTPVTGGTTGLQRPTDRPRRGSLSLSTRTRPGKVRRGGLPQQAHFEIFRGRRPHRRATAGRMRAEGRPSESAGTVRASAREDLAEGRSG